MVFSYFLASLNVTLPFAKDMTLSNSQIYSFYSSLFKSSTSQVSSYATLFAQALPRDAHSTPYYYARPQSLPLNYQDRGAQSAQSSGSMGSSGISSISLYALNGPTPTPQSLLPG